MMAPCRGATQKSGIRGLSPARAAQGTGQRGTASVEPGGGFEGHGAVVRLPLWVPQGPTAQWDKRTE